MGIIGVALAQNAQTAKEIIVRFSCEASAAPLDFVHIDPANERSVIVNTDNLSLYQTIGIIKNKPEATEANVLILGVIAGFTGLTTGGRIMLGLSGQVTQTPPSSGYLQHLGVAVSSTEILVIPSNERVKRS